MNLSVLEKGKEFKNYRTLCESLNLPVKTGNAKIAQLKDLSRYVNYEKVKNSFIIKDVYDVPLPPNNNVTKYIPLIEKLILHIVFENGAENNFYVNKGKLYAMLKMINEKYSSMKYHKMQISKRYNISQATIKDFYNTSDDLLERNVVQALKSLESQSLIKYNEVYSVCEIKVNEIYSEINMYDHIDDFGDTKTVPIYDSVNKVKREHRQATDEETRIILALQRERLEQLNCHDLKSVYTNGLKKEFYEPIKKYLLDNHNIEYYYTSYELIFNKNHITDAYIKNQSYLMDDESYYIISSLLNNNISDKLKSMANDRHVKSLKSDYNSKLKEVRSTEDYLSDVQLLINKLIHCTEP